ncbi:hypothetical protein PTKIN_Ptkin02bG0115600 [Pterospermum kingtungense]
MSPAEFVVPIHKYIESIKNNYPTGLRFEGEEAPEQRFSGTMIGCEDVDPIRWPGSKWSCLKGIPWKIGPASPPAVDVLPHCRQKRSRPSMASSPADTVVLIMEGSFKTTMDSSPENGFPKTLQGQESLNQGDTIADNKYPSRGQNQAETSFADDEQRNPVHSSDQLLEDIMGKFEGVSARTCIKVHKQGIAVGRSVDLTKFGGYDELIAELDRIFEFNGELITPNKKWLGICIVVRRIFIYTREEIKRMGRQLFNLIVEENSPGKDQKTGLSELNNLMRSMSVGGIKLCTCFRV